MPAEADPEARDRLLDALASGVSKSEAARRAGYSRMQVWRLLREPGFAARLAERIQANPPPAGEVKPGEPEPRSVRDRRLALETLREIMEGAEERTRKLADFLLRLAHRKPIAEEICSILGVGLAELDRELDQLRALAVRHRAEHRIAASRAMLQVGVGALEAAEAATKPAEAPKVLRGGVGASAEGEAEAAAWLDAQGKAGGA